MKTYDLAVLFIDAGTPWTAHLDPREGDGYSVPTDASTHLTVVKDGIEYVFPLANIRQIAIEALDVEEAPDGL